MAFGRVVKIAKTLRNHWKKSVFFTGVLGYGVIYLKNHLETRSVMRVYCERAREYGGRPIDVQASPRHVTVILNPNANKRKASDDFEKYCAPLLHLAGVFVEVKRTESEGHAKTITDALDGTDAIVVAGGDGTLSEVVTGLMRKHGDDDSRRLIPIGVLPLGRHNSVANSFFPKGERPEKVRQLADATLAVVEEVVRPADVMKIQSLEDDLGKPIYALGSLRWGAYRDAEARKDRYWVFGPLRRYATYVFNGFKNNLTWNCDATIDYNPPCEGCSNCKRRAPKVQQTSWLQKFIKEENSDARFLSISNPECAVSHRKDVSTPDLEIVTTNLRSDRTSKLILQLAPKQVGYWDFVQNGFRLEKGERVDDMKESIQARAIRLEPKGSKGSWYSIDNEEFEVKPVHVVLLPKVLNMFCKRELEV